MVIQISKHVILIFRSLLVEAKSKNMPVGFLDPQVMSLDSINFDRKAVLQYVQKAFTKYSSKDFIMFAYNSGGSAGCHWIVVIIVQRWNKVIYLDPNKSVNQDFSVLRLLIDE
jgi:amino-acid N-acetyltransferase